MHQEYKIMHVVGARPNFMKVAPIIEAFNQYNESVDGDVRVSQILVHTGQHYDHALSELFFNELGMPKPDINLEIGSGTHGQQTGRIMEKFEEVLNEKKPDAVLVVGDVNSTMACTIDAKKLGIPVIHVESGLRSRDMTMPEEINRLVTDVIADLLLTTDHLADQNLKSEGVSEEKIVRVGNVMIDTLVKHKEKALAKNTISDFDLLNKDGSVKPYALVTLHRPGNVDDYNVFKGIGEALAKIGEELIVIFPVHPRTTAKMKNNQLLELFSLDNGIHLVDPVGYLDFLNLMSSATLILTDSGGIQEESTILGVPCLTLRPNTERPITIEQGTNILVGNKKEDIIRAAMTSLAQDACEKKSIPELWDGRAAERIAPVIVDWLKRNSNSTP